MYVEMPNKKEMLIGSIPSMNLKVGKWAQTWKYKMNNEAHEPMTVEKLQFTMKFLAHEFEKFRFTLLYGCGVYLDMCVRGVWC